MRKANNVSTDKELKGVRKVVGKFYFPPFNQFRSFFSNDSLLNAGLVRGTADFSSDSSVDNSWISDENDILPGKEYDTKVVMNGFAPIDRTE